MASNIVWQPQNFNAVRFNPNAGLAVAQRAFTNVTDIVSNQEKAASLATHRKNVLNQQASNAEDLNASRNKANLLANRRQDFVEEAPARNVAEQERLLKLSNNQGILANNIANNAGRSRAESFFENPENQAAISANPGFQNLAGLQQDGMGPIAPKNAAAVQDFSNQFVENNKRLLSDPTTFKAQVLTDLLDSGKFGRAEANEIANQKTRELFPTMDPAVALKLLQKPGTGNTGSGRNGSGSGGSNKLFTNAPNVLDKQTLINNFTENNDITNKTAFSLLGTRPLDPSFGPFDRDPTKQDISTFVDTMAKGPNGVRPEFALQYLQTLIDTDGSVPFNIEDLKGQELKDFQTQAKDFRASQERTFNSKGGQQSLLQQQAANQANITNSNNTILNRLNPDQSTREKRLATFFSGLPQGSRTTPQQAVTANAIDVDSASTTAPGTNQGNILPPATTNNKSSILSNSTPKSSLRVRHNQGIIDLVSDKLNDKIPPTQDEAIAALQEIEKIPFLQRKVNPALTRRLTIAAQGGDPLKERSGRAK